MQETRNWRTTVVCLAVAAVMAACASRGPRTPAPVEDRSSGARAPATAAPGTEAPRPVAGADNAGKAGFYTVKPGDTLIRIALDAGQNWKDIARWNNLDNPNVIEVGQVLRVVPPGSDVARAGTPPASAASAPRSATPASGAASTAVASVPPASAAIPGATVEDDIAWGWPTAAAGLVLANFDEQRNKGVDIGGKAGDAVLAAADGRVVYAGAGLRGYGNLVILKHNNTYLSAYAHNQALLVKEDQAVRKGQKIAEMGNSDADRVKLHFEIRRQGKPVDPARYLPTMR
ncbi:peptidoglycan DD-metalloendopeptidase family protein [Ramlibacter sp. PS4R-6]|uniref:peptidoglycan DD-metalloendopeptidase family protein n=1 Tax=Ramlibacter sp. PS4R-6 TaxID=3133438 RepID=UPI0030972B93